MKFDDLEVNWDMIIIGGGITGAGIFLETVRLGLKVLLVEQQDFAWGTSSRSSKMIHGGLRYLKQGRLHLMRTSVNERENLLKQASGLVDPLGFLLPIYKKHGPGKLLMALALNIYGMLASFRQHKFYKKKEFSDLCPQISTEQLIGGYHFLDAQVDDARLVLRLINQAVTEGGTAINYTKAVKVNRNQQGKVVGLVIQDSETTKTCELSSNLLINSTGVWAEKLHPSPDKNKHIRPLRGSHLVLPAHILPVSEAVSFFHPKDKRPVFVLPWEGVVIYGTTDIDHKQDLNKEPRISQEEISYLLEGLRFYFPAIKISAQDCISTYSGIRPVLSSGKVDPAKESREHSIWIDNGLITVTGGKLTTFRKLAFDTIKAARSFIRFDKKPCQKIAIFDNNPEITVKSEHLSPVSWYRLAGRYGERLNKLIDLATPEDLTAIPGTNILWAEIKYAAKYEQVNHLSDLLLRRVRLGLLCQHGGCDYLGKVQNLCQPYLTWSQERWQNEKRMYRQIWHEAYTSVRGL